MTMLLKISKMKKTVVAPVKWWVKLTRTIYFIIDGHDIFITV